MSEHKNIGLKAQTFLILYPRKWDGELKGLARQGLHDPPRQGGEASFCAGLVTEDCVCLNAWESLFSAAWQLARGQCDKEETDPLVFTYRQLPALGSPTVPDSLLCCSSGSSEIHSLWLQPSWVSLPGC